MANRFKGFVSRLLHAEFPHLRLRLPTLWSSVSYIVATVGVISAETVQRYLDTRRELR